MVNATKQVITFEEQDKPLTEQNIYKKRGPSHKIFMVQGVI